MDLGYAWRHLLLRVRRFLSPRHQTMFGTVRMYTVHKRGRPMRILDLDDTQQSATYLDGGWCDPPFLYMSMCDLVFDAIRPARNLLMLGGGGFAYPKHVVAHHPEARIDVVELDPAMVKIARKHFYLDRLMREYRTEETGRLRVIVDDAVKFVTTCAQEGRQYDAIVNDCFVADNPLDSLFSVDAIRAVASCIAPQGLYVVNLITALTGDDAKPLYALAKALSQCFVYVLVLPCYRLPVQQRDNALVVAAQHDPHLDGAIMLFESVC